MAEFEVTEPGVYDIPEDLYHRDPVKGGSLSYSGAKKLLTEGGAALYRYERDHPAAPSNEMELGTAAHRTVLGVGQELHEVKARDWRTKKAQEEADEARAEGKLPLLSKDLVVVHDMAAALRKHKWASALLDQDGTPEASAFWPDPEYGTWWRCRFDRMPRPDSRRLPVCVDYKTTAKDGASQAKFSKSIADFRYYLQASVYTAGYNAIFGDRIGAPASFAFIAQERTPPYRVAVYELHPDALRKGREDAMRAMEIYRDCTEAEADDRADAWPGYDPEIQVIDLPYWTYREDS